MIKIWFISKIRVLYQMFMIRAISPSSRYVVEGFVLHHLIKFRALYNRFKPILYKKKQKS